MNEVSIIGLDLAKNIFQAHGAGADGSVVFRRKLSRAQLLKFLGDQQPCFGGHGGLCKRPSLGPGKSANLGTKFG